jgi:hypothetical protein
MGCRWNMQEPGEMARIKYRRKKCEGDLGCSYPSEG